MSVSGAGGPLDSEDRELVVPDMTATDLALGTPRVYVARTAREFQAINKDVDATPTASRDFRRTERLVIRTDAYAPGNAVVTMTSRLLNKQGQRMANLTVAVPPAPGQAYSVDLPLASLAQGEYLLELSATTEGQKPATELIAFRVGG